MLIGTDSILSYITLSGAKGFRVYQGSTITNKQPIFICEGRGGTTEALEQFKRFATLYSSYTMPVEYTIVVYPNGKANPGKDELEEAGGPSKIQRSQFYFIAPGTVGGYTPQNNTPAQIGSVKSEAQIREEIRIELEKEQEYEEMENRLSELEQSQTRLNGYIEKALGYVLPMLQGKFAPAQSAPSLAGEPQTNNDRDIRITNALRTMAQHDGRIVEHLEKLANIAKNKPETYKGLLGMLDNF